MVTCASCGTESPEGFRFCPACGAPLTRAEPRTERKIREPREGMDEALNRLLERYPWLVDDDADLPPKPTGPSGRKVGMSARWVGPIERSRAFLVQRFPALPGRVRP